jgi:hypothetical protein
MPGARIIAARMPVMPSQRVAKQDRFSRAGDSPYNQRKRLMRLSVMPISFGLYFLEITQVLQIAGEIAATLILY